MQTEATDSRAPPTETRLGESSDPHTQHVLPVGPSSEPALVPVGEADTLPARTELLPPSSSSTSEEHRVSLISEEVTQSEATPERSHSPHAVPERSSHRSVSDHHHHHHHHHTIPEGPTHQVHHHTSLAETEKEEKNEAEVELEEDNEDEDKKEDDEVEEDKQDEDENEEDEEDNKEFRHIQKGGKSLF